MDVCKVRGSRRECASRPPQTSELDLASSYLQQAFAYQSPIHPFFVMANVSADYVP
jgi:hypothetical protein